MKEKIFSLFVAAVCVFAIGAMVITGINDLDEFKIDVNDVVPEIEEVELTEEAIAAYAELVNMAKRG